MGCASSQPERKEQMMHRMLIVAVAAVVVATVLIAGGLGSGVSYAAGKTPRCDRPPQLEADDFEGDEIDNPYYPLKPGTTYRYEGEVDGESAEDVFEVTNDTKKILGVTTTVVHDQLYVDGELTEDTF